MSRKYPHAHMGSDSSAASTRGFHPEVSLAYDVARELPSLTREARLATERHGDPRAGLRLVCSLCGNVPRHKYMLEPIEGGYICRIATACEQRQAQGGRPC